MGKVFEHLFRLQQDETADQERVMEAAQRHREWARNPEYAHLMQWLSGQIDEPVPMNSDVVLSAVRANTFKEVKQYLKQREADVSRVLGEE